MEDKMEGCKKPAWKFREKNVDDRLTGSEEWRAGMVGCVKEEGMKSEEADLRDVLLSSSSPLCSSSSTLPALLREYSRTLSNGFSRSWKAGREKLCSVIIVSYT